MSEATTPRLMNYTVNVYTWNRTISYEAVCANHLGPEVAHHIPKGDHTRNCRLTVNGTTVMDDDSGYSTLNVVVVGAKDSHHLYGVTCSWCAENIKNGWDRDGNPLPA